MTRLATALASALVCLAAVQGWTAPSVFPTGTTIYDPERAWNGYTVLSPLSSGAAVVIDMNGNVVKQWDDYNNAAGGPARVLPGGGIVAATGARPPHQESLELVQRDFDGNTVWSFRRNEQVETRDGETIWSSRQHHDWQRADLPAGYYSPEAETATTGANTLLLTHTNRIEPNVSDVLLEDDRIIEVSPEGEIVWEWTASKHIDELGFDAIARTTIASAPGFSEGRGSFDWLHINSATYVGPNHWFDDGDQRFAPDNVIISGREGNIVAVIDRGGSVVWRLGPEFDESEELLAIGQIIGQHQPHFIPKGLPGAGNVLVFDNGGASGYGAASPVAPDGDNIYARTSSRVLEIDPVTLELVWSYQAGNFLSWNISSAQRLANGNTLITEGAGGRLFEVTNDGEIVWEFLYPLDEGGRNDVYRGYRLPYEWIPQLDQPDEVAVTPPPPGEFLVP